VLHIFDFSNFTVSLVLIIIISRMLILQVEKKRKEREEAFRRMEIEALLVNDEKHPTSDEKETLQQGLQDKSILDLLDVIDRSESSGNVASRSLAGRMVLERLDKRMSDEDQALASLSLKELYGVSVGDYVDATDYQMQRAQELLSDALIRYAGRGD
jgi:hypothetical protein